MNIAMPRVALAHPSASAESGHCFMRTLMRTAIFSLLLLLCLNVTAAAQPQRPDDIAPELWQQLQQMDQQLEDLRDMEARFTRYKHTPLLKRPLTSTGRVRVKGSMMRWDTDAPSESTTLMRDGEVRLYQPQAKRLEIYPLQQRFAMFGSSPQPRLTELVQRFDAERRPASELFDAIEEDGEQYLALHLTPRDEQLREHVEAMDVLIDRDAGRIQRLRLDHGGAESVEYRFTDLRVNVGLEDDVFEMDLPEDVQVVRPLEGDSP